MTPRQERKAKQAEEQNPINFTCGGCKKVQPFDSEKPYVCPDCNYGSKE